MKFSLKKHPNHAVSHKKLSINFGSNPRIDWIAVVVLAFAAGIISVYGAVSLFLNIRDGEAPSSNAAAIAGTTVNAAEISKVVTSHETRNAEFETIQRTPYARSDDPVR
ncbi:MAG: hypothetical protein JWO73_936 [Candidatus Taylorbacteria bacterium]|nr:hypothetical protein [Candidatus Taylorbacteria bacterium]